MEYRSVKQVINEKNAFSRFAGIEVTEVGPGSATCVMPVRAEHMNLFGTVNAAATYALAETAFGAAANSHGYATVAVNLAIAYVAPATKGTLTARAEELSAGNRMATYSVRVTDDSGALVADVQATGYRTKTSLEDI